ncbi:MAG TPA: hypothetical protein VMU33_20475 [Burkholderiaceae bacterium]|nr:hypothetical protein [Burkholderiaceae bacterium]
MSSVTGTVPLEIDVGAAPPAHATIGQPDRMIDENSLRQLRQRGYRGEQIPQHRAFRRLRLTWRLGVSVLVLAPLWIAAYVLAYPVLIDWWQQSTEFWVTQLGLPGTVVRVPLDAVFVQFDRIGIDLVPAPITLRIWLIHAGVTLVAFLWTFRMSERSLPLAYLIRIVCALHTASLLFFLFFEKAFPYVVLDHTRDFFGFTLFFHMIVPLMLTASYYVMEGSWRLQTAATAVVLAYYLVAVPFQLVAHAALIWLLSPLAMPMLYLLFGPMMNVLTFVALYAWVVTWGDPQIA